MISSRGILRGIDGTPEPHFLTGQQVDYLQRHCRGELTAGNDFAEHVKQKLYYCFKNQIIVAINQILLYN